MKEIIALMFLLIVFIFIKCSKSFEKSKWGNIFNSDPSDLTDIQFLNEGLGEYINTFKKIPHQSENCYPFIIELSSICDTSCHEKLRHSVSKGRYNIVSAEVSQIITTLTYMNHLKASLPFIKSFIPMHPALKIDKDLNSIIRECQSNDDFVNIITLHVTIFHSSKNAQSALYDSLQSYFELKKIQATISNEEIKLERNNLMTVSTTCQNLNSVTEILSNVPEVSWIEIRLNVKHHNRWSKGVCQSGSYTSTPLHSSNLTGLGYIVGVADTGIDMSSCYFYDPIVKTPFNSINSQHRKVVTYISKYGDKVDDTEGHGTHVSASVSAKSYKNYGDYAKYNGGAYDSKIAFFDIGKSTSDSTTSTLSLPSDLYNSLFTPLYDAGARIFSNSWGATASSPRSAANKYTADARSVDSFMWEYTDTLILFAAGNDGDIGDYTVTSPSTNKNGICVGASLNDYQSWQAYAGPSVSTLYSVDSVANFSSKGPTADRRLKPDLVVPGNWITSAASLGNSSTYHCGISAKAGTSQASPTLAAAAVLVKQYFEQGYYPSGRKNPSSSFTPSGALLKAMLIHSGQQLHTLIDDSGSSKTITDYPSIIQGYGRVQLDSVINFGRSRLNPLSLFVIGAAASSDPRYAALSATGDFHEYKFQTSATTDTVKVSLVYTDYYGTVGSSKALVNDLDLQVLHDATSTATLPIPSNANSRYNNIEVVVLESPLPYSNYTVRVSAYSLSYKQPYALVITGVVVAYNGSTSSSEGDASESFSPAFSSVGAAVIGVFSAGILIAGVLLAWILISYRSAASPAASSPPADELNLEDVGGVTYVSTH